VAFVPKLICRFGQPGFGLFSFFGQFPEGIGYERLGSYSSWLNQIETWCGIITRQAIRRGTFASVQVLIRTIRAYIASWNTDPRPFTWTATTDEILAKVRLTQLNIKKFVANNSK
jgi:hypothetical protein